MGPMPRASPLPSLLVPAAKTTWPLPTGRIRTLNPRRSVTCLASECSCRSSKTSALSLAGRLPGAAAILLNRAGKIGPQVVVDVAHASGQQMEIDFIPLLWKKASTWIVPQQMQESGEPEGAESEEDR